MRTCQSSSNRSLSVRLTRSLKRTSTSRNTSTLRRTIQTPLRLWMQLKYPKRLSKEQLGTRFTPTTCTHFSLVISVRISLKERSSSKTATRCFTTKSQRQRRRCRTQVGWDGGSSLTLWPSCSVFPSSLTVWLKQLTFRWNIGVTSWEKKWKSINHSGQKHMVENGRGRQRRSKRSIVRILNRWERTKIRNFRKTWLSKSHMKPSKTS